MPPLLEVKGLHTEFRTGAGLVRAVDGISYTVEHGDQRPPNLGGNNWTDLTQTSVYKANNRGPYLPSVPVNTLPPTPLYASSLLMSGTVLR